MRLKSARSLVRYRLRPPRKPALRAFVPGPGALGGSHYLVRHPCDHAGLAISSPV
jgi:hypothetical protein